MRSILIVAAAAAAASARTDFIVPTLSSWAVPYPPRRAAVGANLGEKEECREFYNQRMTRVTVHFFPSKLYRSARRLTVELEFYQFTATTVPSYKVVKHTDKFLEVSPVVWMHWPKWTGNKENAPSVENKRHIQLTETS